MASVLSCSGVRTASMRGTVRWEQFQKIKSQFPLLRPKLQLSYPELQATAKL